MSSELLSVGSHIVTLKSQIENKEQQIISDLGVCWSSSPNPTISDHTANNGIYEEDYVYTVIESPEIQPNSTYYIRAYLITGENVIYGNEIAFTSTETVTDVDGNVYPTVKIGEQLWMMENLKTTKLNDGTPIESLNYNSEWRKADIAFSWYNYNKAYGILYGALYNGKAIQSNKLAPEGWHVPTTDEWNILIEQLGGEQMASKYLKSHRDVAYDTDISPTHNYNLNSSGFSARMGGSSAPRLGTFKEVKQAGYWWASDMTITKEDKLLHYFWMLNGNSVVFQSGASENSSSMVYFSVRCVKN
ncbi:hypothetical protein GCM10023331_34830 [Algivirga pacifica]|uniref:Fibrobacter succinogenes major paralogous domain-containing protein n=2 Tax=Algivirga pacifica TaxID=1162670 RepID=A0ABP9DI03_9BACT